MRKGDAVEPIIVEPAPLVLAHRWTGRIQEAASSAAHKLGLSKNDGANLYLRFTWKQPADGAEEMDKDNPVKLAFMLEGNKVAGANLSGCWETCHTESGKGLIEAKGEK